MTSQLDTNLSLIYKNMVGFNNIYNDNLNLLFNIKIEPRTKGNPLYKYE